MFRFVKGLSPKIIKEIFQFREECYYQLRSRASLDIPRLCWHRTYKIFRTKNLENYSKWVKAASKSGCRNKKIGNQYHTLVESANISSWHWFPLISTTTGKLFICNMFYFDKRFLLEWIFHWICLNFLLSCFSHLLLDFILLKIFNMLFLTIYTNCIFLFVNGKWNKIITTTTIIIKKFFNSLSTNVIQPDENLFLIGRLSK